MQEATVSRTTHPASNNRFFLTLTETIDYSLQNVYIYFIFSLNYAGRLKVKITIGQCSIVLHLHPVAGWMSISDTWYQMFSSWRIFSFIIFHAAVSVKKRTHFCSFLNYMVDTSTTQWVCQPTGPLQYVTLLWLRTFGEHKLCWATIISHLTSKISEWVELTWFLWIRCVKGRSVGMLVRTLVATTIILFSIRGYWSQQFSTIFFTPTLVKFVAKKWAGGDISAPGTAPQGNRQKNLWYTWFSNCLSCFIYDLKLKAQTTTPLGIHARQTKKSEWNHS